MDTDIQLKAMNALVHMNTAIKNVRLYPPASSHDCEFPGKALSAPSGYITTGCSSGLCGISEKSIDPGKDFKSERTGSDSFFIPNGYPSQLRHQEHLF